MKPWTWATRGLLSLFLQTPCPLCLRSTPYPLCPTCQRQVERCQFTPEKALLQTQPAVFAWGLYGGTLKRAIAALKYENQPQLAQPLGQWLGEAWLDSTGKSPRDLVVVPIPMHPEKKRKRGYDQAELLAEGFCHVTDLPLLRQGLERVRATTPQFELTATEREANLRDAFTLGRDLHHRSPSPTVLLIDDVYTTGATARAAIQVLRRHGIRVRAVLAIAAPEKPTGDGQSVAPEATPKTQTLGTDPAR